LTVAAGSTTGAARELWGRVPLPSKAGQGLRTASALLTAARFVGRNENKQLLALLAQLAALTDAVTRLRENQHRAAQAAAARRAAEQLRLTTAQRAAMAPGGLATATEARRQRFSYSQDTGPASQSVEIIVGAAGGVVRHSWRIEAPPHSYDALDLAERCVVDWSSLLRAKGLL
jgi:hypothetical protein